MIITVKRHSSLCIKLRKSRNSKIRLPMNVIVNIGCPSKSFRTMRKIKTQAQKLINKS